MKYGAAFVLILAALLAGCAKPAVDTKIPPVAIIDSVAPSVVNEGDSIKFTGHGVSTTGQIIGYNWRSSINGDLSKQATFDTTTLSAGSHTIWFSVQDNYGNWSKEIATNVLVNIPGCAATMSVNIFTVSPPEITAGDSATLTWDVSGDGTIRIDPNVGNVANSGSRAIQPTKDTVYTIYATNDVGITTATASVAVSPIPLRTATLYSVAAESGTILNNTYITSPSSILNVGQVLVGEDKSQVQMQGILSFDISSIPYDAVIKSVQLDLSRSLIFNYPFPWQGDLNIYNLKYGQMQSLQNPGQLTFLPSTSIFRWGTNSQITQMPSVPFSSLDMVNAVQTQVNTHNSRFQVRLQFDKYYYYNIWNQSTTTNSPLPQNPPNGNVGNYIDIGVGHPTLIVSYILSD